MDYVTDDQWKVIRALLTPANALVVDVMLTTGLRVGDVVQLKTRDLKRRMSVHEAKTGKRRTVYLRAELLNRLRSQAGEEFVFSGRGVSGHRTRQAVYIDLKRAAVAMRLDRDLGCHSARKSFAVKHCRRFGVEATQRALNHRFVSTTMLYAAADLLVERGGARHRATRSRGRSSRGGVQSGGRG